LGKKKGSARGGVEKGLDDNGMSQEKAPFWRKAETVLFQFTVP